MTQALKKILRQQALLKLQQLDANYKQSLDHAVIQQVINLLQSLGRTVTLHGQKVALYRPQPYEVDIETLLIYLATHESTILYPRTTVNPPTLTFHRIQDDQDWEEGNFKIFQPQASCPQDTPAIFVIPLIAYNSHGYRLGYGKGFYDRFLKQLNDQQSHFITIGLGYNFQQIPEDFHEAHDHRLNYIVNENGAVNLIQ